MFVYLPNFCSLFSFRWRASFGFFTFFIFWFWFDFSTFLFLSSFCWSTWEVFWTHYSWNVSLPSLFCFCYCLWYDAVSFLLLAFRLPLFFLFLLRHCFHLGIWQLSICPRTICFLAGRRLKEKKMKCLKYILPYGDIQKWCLQANLQICKFQSLSLIYGGNSIRQIISEGIFTLNQYNKHNLFLQCWYYY